MPPFTIDSEKCQCDGLCAQECPVGCIVFERGQLPVPHTKKKAYCIECGHCMAICPKGAFQLERFGEQAGVNDPTLQVSGEQIDFFLRSRRSVRAFRNEPVRRDLLERLLDLTQYAPSGHNARPIRWAVAATPEKVAKVAEATVNWMRGEVEIGSDIATFLHLAGVVRAWDAGVDLVCRQAPALAVAYGPKRGITPAEDGIIAVTYLELAATGAKLGACWCGYVQMAANRDVLLQELLGIADEYKTYGAIMLGKPARKICGIPPRPEAEVNWL